MALTSARDLVLVKVGVDDILTDLFHVTLQDVR